MQKVHDQPPSPESLRRGYESLAVNHRGLMIFLFFFLLNAAVLHTGLWVLVKYYQTLPRDADVPQSAVQPMSPFTEPHLQPTQQHPRQPWQDLEALRESDRQVFQQLGWTPDAQTGAPHIPDDIVSALATRHPSPQPGPEKSSSTQPAPRNGGAR